MRYQTPQFIDLEDKIFGPLTLWQFIYLAGGAGLAFTAWTLAPIKLLAIPVVIPIVLLTLALAFYKVNSRPFVRILESAFLFSKNKRLYVWKKVPKKRKVKKDTPLEPDSSVLNVPRLSDSKLKELAWSLDIHDITTEKMHAKERAQQN